MLVYRNGKSRLQMTGTMLVLVCALAGGCRAQSQLVIDDEQCEQNVASHPDIALPHCTALVESGQLSQENLALALILRGSAYRNMGDYDRAIQDFNAAIRIKPGIPNAFNNRGITYDYKGGILDAEISGVACRRTANLARDSGACERKRGQND